MWGSWKGTVVEVSLDFSRCTAMKTVLVQKAQYSSEVSAVETSEGAYNDCDGLRVLANPQIASSRDAAKPLSTVKPIRPQSMTPHIARPEHVRNGLTYSLYLRKPGTTFPQYLTRP